MNVLPPSTAGPPSKQAKPRDRTVAVGLARAIWLACGIALTGVGLLGVVIPGLPTTIFLILALWCFARSSERFHNWLWTHPRFGPSIRAWCESGTIPTKAKIAAITTMVVSFAILLAIGASDALLAVVAVALSAGATFILTRPNDPD